MAIIRKAIGGLNPGSDYLFTIKPKNVELVASDNEQDSIRVSVPAFSGTPSTITGLQLASNFQTVIFKFDPINDRDLSYFEYQLYDNSAGTGDPINWVYSKANNSSSVKISGTNVANVFLVAVDNSTTGTPKQYWGRVRVVNTAENPSTNWSSLVASGELALIGDTFISSLTAAKITSGTISAAEIFLSGAISKIQSSNYDPSVPSNTRQGWIIKGDGTAEFSAASIRGTLTAAAISINANNYWTTSDGGTTFQFKVGNATNYFLWNGTNIVVNGSTITGGSLAGINAGTNKIYIGTGNYANADTAFYVDSSGNFSLKDKLYWNGTTLTIRGNLQFNDGSVPGTFDNGDAITGGSIGGLGITSSKIYAGAGNWANTDTGFYLDSNGSFSLKNKLYWNATTNALNIDGTVTIGGTAASTVVSGAASGASAVQPSGVNSNVTSISGGVISTGTINLNSVNVNTGTSGARLSIDSTGIKAYNSGGTNTVSISSDGSAFFQGSITGSTGQFAGDIIGGQGEFAYEDASQGTLRLIRKTGSSYAPTITAFIWKKTNDNSLTRIGQFRWLSAEQNAANTTPTWIFGEGIRSEQASSISDMRLKNIADKEIDALQILNKIKTTEFSWKDTEDARRYGDPNKKEYGYIAQQVHEIIPEATVVGSDELDENGKIINKWYVLDNKLTPYLIRSIQQLCARIELLETQLSK